MKSRPDLHQVLASIAGRNALSPLLVATVLKAEGSTPVDAGAKAVIAAEGLIAGTIGGGAVEGEALQRAGQMLGGPGSTVYDFTLQGPGGTDPRPICGGRMRVLLQPLSEADRHAYAAANAALGTRTRGILETAISHETGSGSKTRWLMEALDPQCQTALETLRVAHLPHADGTRERLLEPVLPLPVLLIVGAGHVGQALAAQAALAGFELAVIDDREELMGPDGFPEGTRLIKGDIPPTVQDFPFDEDTYVVLATRGHYADGLALKQCLGRPAAYLGMIGSRRKILLMRQHFLTTGKATEEEFDCVYAPIGLDIGAETAPEIATSILAQIIAVRRGALITAQGRNPVSIA
jgi:xanthine dehydrogenase accessory factor